MKNIFAAAIVVAAGAIGTTASANDTCHNLQGGPDRFGYSCVEFDANVERIAFLQDAIDSDLALLNLRNVERDFLTHIVDTANRHLFPLEGFTNQWQHFESRTHNLFHYGWTYARTDEAYNHWAMVRDNSTSQLNAGNPSDVVIYHTGGDSFIHHWEWATSDVVTQRYDNALAALSSERNDLIDWNNALIADQEANGIPEITLAEIEALLEIVNVHIISNNVTSIIVEGDYFQIAWASPPYFNVGRYTGTLQEFSTWTGCSVCVEDTSWIADVANYYLLIQEYEALYGPLDLG